MRIYTNSYPLSLLVFLDIQNPLVLIPYDEIPFPDANRIRELVDKLHEDKNPKTQKTKYQNFLNTIFDTVRAIAKDNPIVQLKALEHALKTIQDFIQLKSKYNGEAVDFNKITREREILNLKIKNLNKILIDLGIQFSETIFIVSIESYLKFITKISDKNIQLDPKQKKILEEILVQFSQDIKENIIINFEQFYELIEKTRDLGISTLDFKGTIIKIEDFLEKLKKLGEGLSKAKTKLNYNEKIELFSGIKQEYRQYIERLLNPQKP